MEPEKHKNLDKASDHKNVDELDDDNAGVGRSYECNFCKRGFTNAQALGGHMNIHRKDKAKLGKQKTKEGSSSLIIQNKYSNIVEDNNFLDTRSFPTVPSSDDHQRQSNSYLTAVINYQVYLPSSNTNPSSLVAPPQDDVNRRLFDDHKDVVRNIPANIGRPQPSRDTPTSDDGENEVDLELRLGHNP